MLGCFLLSLFTLLPVVKVENATTISIGGLLMAGTGVLYMACEKSLLPRSKRRMKSGEKTSLDGSRLVMGAQLGLILLAVIITRSSISSIQAKQGLPLGNQIVGWLTLVVSLTLPYLYKFYPEPDSLHRLVIIFLTFSPTFVILTISYEGLFYFVFSVVLVTWVRLEKCIYKASKAPTGPIQKQHSTSATKAKPPATNKYRALTLSDTRTALIFFFLLQSAFFSTGNIASVSSFSLDAVYRLIPIFDPFSQGALLLYKLLVPFALISAILGILNLELDLEPSALFMLVMALSDVLTLNFFWMVRDEGSWLDIGTSISHFFIGSLLNIFVAGLEGLSAWFIAGVEVESDGHNEDGEKENKLNERESSTGGLLKSSTAAVGKDVVANGKPA